MVQVSQDAVSLANRLRPILLRLARHLRTETHKQNLTGSQVSILVAIEFHPGITARRLALREGLSGPGVSGHLARLEGQRLISRRRTEDGRGIGLHLTPAGEAVLAAVRDLRTTWLATRIASRDAEDREAIESVLDALDRLSMGDR